MQDSKNSQHQFHTEIAGLTDIGNLRSDNEDYFVSYCDKEQPFAYLVVTDGMGGYSGGSLASKLAADVVADQLHALLSPTFIHASKSQQLETVDQTVKDSISLANSTVVKKKHTDLSLTRMGTTIVLAVVWQNYLTIANVGDSRAYLWQANQLTQFSKDHSLVQELIDNGSITPQEARTHRHRNQLTRAIGVKTEISAEIRKLYLTGDSLLLLCTDGLTEYLNEQDIASELSCARPLSEHCYRLTEAANKAGGKDNITIAIAQFSQQQ